MASDQPPEIPAEAPRPRRCQCLGVEAAAMPAVEPCKCEGEAPHLPLDAALLALKPGSVSLETVLAFRRILESFACKHRRVLTDDFYRELAKVAYSARWGSGKKQTLAEAVAHIVARKLGYSTNTFPDEISQVAITTVDQAVGTFGTDGNQFDPTCETKAGNVPSLLGYTWFRTRRIAQTAIRHRSGYCDVDNAPDHHRMRTDAIGAAQIATKIVHSAFVRVAAHQTMRIEVELKLVEIGRAAVAQFGKTSSKKLRLKNLEKTLHIVTCGVTGDPGHCVLLDTQIGGVKEIAPINLGTKMEQAVAVETYHNKNGTVLTRQVAEWMDEILGMLGADPEIRSYAAALVCRALELRRQEHSLLDALTDIMAGLTDDDVETRVQKWQGPPERDRKDGQNGRVEGVTGVGIAHVPYLFGLINPLDADVPGLDGLSGADGPTP